MNLVDRNNLRKRRKRRSRIKGDKMIPRLVVYRSNKRVYLQLVDDTEGKTLGGIRGEIYSKKENGIETAFKAGEKIGKLAGKLGIKKAVFDRSGYKFHGRVKAVYEGAAKSGLLFSEKKKK